MPFGEPRTSARVVYSVGFVMNMDYVGDIVNVNIQIPRLTGSAPVPEAEMDAQIIQMVDALAALDCVQSATGIRTPDGTAAFYPIEES